MATFRALRLHKTDSPTPDVKIEHLTAKDLSTGNVLISNEFSSLNYKDALAVTGKGKIIRDFPMVQDRCGRSCFRVRRPELSSR